MNGCLIGKLLVNLKEVADEFGPRVAESMPNYSNLLVTCSKSGKLNKGPVRKWSEQVLGPVVDCLHEKKCVLYVDSRSGHTDQGLYRMANKQIAVKVFPPESTSILQPVDVYCLRQWKDFAKMVTEHCLFFNYRVDTRNDILRLQSLIFNQFQHPNFRPLWLCAWRLAGFETPEVSFKNLREMLFEH